MSDSLRLPHGLEPATLLCPRDFPGKNTGVGCRFPLQRIFLTQGMNLYLLLGRWILYHWATQEAQGIQLSSDFQWVWSLFYRYATLSIVMNGLFTTDHMDYSNLDHIYLYMRVKSPQSCLTLCDPMGHRPARLLCPWDFSRWEYWSGLPCPPPGDLPNQPRNWTHISCISCTGKQVLYHWCHPGSPYFHMLNGYLHTFCTGI